MEFIKVGKDGRGLAGAISKALLVLSLTTAGSVASAQPQDHQRIHVPPGGLREALDTLAMTTGITLLYPPRLVAGKTTAGTLGHTSPAYALQRLLDGTGLMARRVGEATFTLVHAVAPGNGVSSPTVEQVETSRTPDEPRAVDLGGMSVTGTRVRGGRLSSPVLTITAEDIHQAGFSNLGDLIRAVPQNFSGGQNPGVPSLGYSGAGIQNQNITGGSALNLRGLGPDATLSLLNGRRMAYGGLSQAVDVDAIPIDAIDRVEILLDGASAIYGTDAVGGVGNVVLKRGFNGASAGAFFGGASRGGMATRQYTASVGETWMGGGLIAAFKDARVDPIFARQREYAREMRSRTTLHPGSSLKSGLVSIHQDVGAKGEARMDVVHATREQHYSLVSPEGHTNDVKAETLTTFFAPEVRMPLPGDWSIALSATRTRSDHLQYQRRTNSGGDVGALAVHDCYCNAGGIYEVSANGRVFAVAGRDLQLAAGLGYRTSSFRHRNEMASVPTASGDESNRFAYLEAILPERPELGGGQTVNRTSLTVALRGEDYEGFGGVIAPKLGLTYGPRADLTLKASWGRSFKAPTLYQRHLPSYVTLANPEHFGGTDYADEATVLVAAGGNPDLDPEQARTWSASLAIHPQRYPELEAELTFYGIDYKHRAIEPVASFAEALANPIYSRFVDHAPPLEALERRVAEAAVLYNFTDRQYDPEDVMALLDLRYTSVARQRLKGIDLTASYDVELASSRLELQAVAAWLRSSQEGIDRRQSFDLAGTVSNPPRFTGRLGGAWSSSGWSVSAFVNHKGGVEDVSNDEKSGSFTTVDVALQLGPTVLAGAQDFEFALGAWNLFDRAPPRTRPWLPGYAPPYDATNYSPVGRYLGIKLSKRWK